MDMDFLMLQNQQFLRTRMSGKEQESFNELILSVHMLYK